ncbi:SREK1: Splicing regulatory glutamine/lysine-rich protein 1 [Crotalus adamanteus]|uniref:SREK1: Splicing regulatory glutamine/lysine-rich protein 1 n=1 Tax=Crotalus adamanteus TaxID=8729 RepID=A0AAW1AUF0_CROAD
MKSKSTQHFANRRPQSEIVLSASSILAHDCAGPSQGREAEKPFHHCTEEPKIVLQSADKHFNWTPDNQFFSL